MCVVVFRRFIARFIVVLILGGCAQRQALALTHGGQERIVLALWARRHSPNVDSSPSFVAYESGLVVYKRESRGSAPRFFAVTLPPGERLSLWGADRLADLAHLEERYPAHYLGDGEYFVDSNTGAVRYALQWRDANGLLRQVVVYGLLEEGKDHPDRRETPPPFLGMVDSLLGFAALEAKPLEVDSVVLVLSRMQLSKAPVQWPSSWPEPHHEGTNDWAEVRLPGRQYREAFEWAAGLSREGLGVRFDDTTWGVDVNVDLPGNPVQYRKSAAQ